MLETGARGTIETIQPQGQSLALRLPLSLDPDVDDILSQGAEASEIAKREAVLDKMRDLIISYTGLVLIDSSMFPQDVS